MGVLNISPMDRTDPELPLLVLSGTSGDLTTSTTSAATATPSGGKFLRLLASVDMYIKTGTETGIVAIVGDFKLAAGIPEYVPYHKQTYLAAIDAS